MGTAEAIVGSWFPSGFHGHFRSKSRNEIMIPYRQHAKPIPPEKFLDRAKVRSNQHLFSRHDNRNSHSSGMADLEIHFNMGLGKKKHASSQHIKNTSVLLDWNYDSYKPFQSSYSTAYQKRNYIMPNNLRTSFNDEQKTRIHETETISAIVKQTEPIHSRKNPELYRKYNRKFNNYSPMLRSAPLLAWNDASTTVEISNKPCVGDTNKRIVPRLNNDPIVKTSTLLTQRNIITWQ